MKKMAKPQKKIKFESTEILFICVICDIKSTNYELMKYGCVCNMCMRTKVSYCVCRRCYKVGNITKEFLEKQHPKVEEFHIESATYEKFWQKLDKFDDWIVASPTDILAFKGSLVSKFELPRNKCSCCNIENGKANTEK